MADGYDVVLGDLRAMKGTFTREHEEYAGIRAKVTPPVAATGDGHLDETLRAVVDLLGMMHEGMARKIEEHAEKLGHAADSYEHREIDNRFLFDDLMAE